MKKLFIILCLLMIKIGYSQSIDNINFEDLKGDYIMLNVNSYKSGKHTKFFISYGDDGRGTIDKNVVRDKFGNEVKSLSTVTILNYLVANGFELISFSTDRMGSHLGFTYLLKNTKN